MRNDGAYVINIDEGLNLYLSKKGDRFLSYSLAVTDVGTDHLFEWFLHTLYTVIYELIMNLIF